MVLHVAAHPTTVCSLFSCFVFKHPRFINFLCMHNTYELILRFAWTWTLWGPSLSLSRSHSVASRPPIRSRVLCQVLYYDTNNSTRSCIQHNWVTSHVNQVCNQLMQFYTYRSTVQKTKVTDWYTYRVFLISAQLGNQHSQSIWG